jgi:hypothetical protein
MDSLPSFLGSKTGLFGAAVAAGAAALSAGRRAHTAISKDPAFATMAYRKYTPRRSFSKRKTTRYMPLMVRPRKSIGGCYKSMVRSTALGSGSITASTTDFLTTNMSLQQVRTADLVGVYRMYHIKKCVIRLVPRVDPANSGVANNFTALIAACCDPESATVPTAINEITASDHSYLKFVNSGNQFTYSFYPKAVISIDNGGATAAVGGYGMNPWIQLNASGIAIPHRSLKLGFQVGASTTVNIDWFFDIHFDVKGMQSAYARR